MRSASVPAVGMSGTGGGGDGGRGYAMLPALMREYSAWPSQCVDKVAKEPIAIKTGDRGSIGIELHHGLVNAIICRLHSGERWRGWRGEGTFRRLANWLPSVIVVSEWLMRVRMWLIIDSDEASIRLHSKL